MKIKRLVGVVVTSVALVACPAGIALAEDDPTTEVQATYDLQDELVISLHTANGVKSQIVHAGNGTAVKFTRVISETIPWETADTSDEVSGGYSLIAPEAAATGGLKTCCSWECGGANIFRYDPIAKDCALYGQGCEVCTLTCTGGYLNCPAGTKKLQPLD